MHFQAAAAVAIALAGASNAETQYTETAAAIANARDTALTLSPTSYVKGKTFDRFVNIWLENTDYAKAAADRTVPSSF